MMVLVVEDEFLVAMDLESFLLANAHTVLGPAVSVEGALHLLEVERPALALLDFNVNGRTVLPVAERLNTLGIPIIMTSAYDGAYITAIEALASARCVRKPFGEAELLRAMELAVPSGKAS